MLVRNPKKRPSAAKMLAVSSLHCFCCGSQLVCVKGITRLPSRSPQHAFLTQQCLNKALTLDLLEKFHNPEKIRTCLVTDEEDMEVSQCFLLSSVHKSPFVVYFTFPPPPTKIMISYLHLFAP